MADNFRAIYTLQHNQWTKNPKTGRQLWPLSIDGVQLTMEEIYARNQKIIASMEASGFMN